MAISSDASEDEFSSPFFIHNKEICLKWNDLIKKYNGRVNGKYTSWSYRLIGQVKSNFHWKIEVSKSTFTATGISVLMHTNVFENLILSINNYNSNESRFYIRKRKFFYDVFIRNKFKQKLLNGYILIGLNRNERKVNELINTLSEIFELNNLYRLEVDGKKLIIKIKSYNKCYQLVEDLMNRRNI